MKSFDHSLGQYFLIVVLFVDPAITPDVLTWSVEDRDEHRHDDMESPLA